MPGQPVSADASRPFDRWGILGAAALHLLLAASLAALCSVDVDEAYSLATSGRPLADTLHRALTFELQPPLYFLTLNLWRLADSGVLWARLLSTACTTGVVLLAPWAVRRYVPGVRAPLVALLLAVNPTLVWAGFTTRGYAMIALLATALLGLAHRAFLDPRPRARDVIATALVAVAALHTQYYLGFLLAGFGVALVTTGRWRAVGTYVIAMLAVAALSAPLLIHTASQVQSHAAVGPLPGLLQSMSTAARHAESLVLSMNDVSFGRPLRWVARALFWGAAALSLVAAVRAGSPLRSQRALALLVATMVAFYGLARSLAGDDALAVRHTIALLVPMLALALALLAAAEGSRRRVALAALVTVVMAGNALWHSFSDLDSNPAHKAAAAWLSANPARTPDQPVFVFPSDSALALGYHFHDANPLIGLPREASLTVYSPATFAITDEAELDARLRAALGSSGEAWLVRYSITHLFGVDLGAPLLATVVDRTFETIETAEFEDCEVLRLKLRSVGRDDRIPGAPPGANTP